MSQTTFGFRMRATFAALSLGASLYLLASPAIAHQGPELPIASGLPPSSYPGESGALAFIHNGGKLNVASVRDTPATGTGLSTLLPPRVPEPGTLGLLILGAPFMLRRRRR